MSFKLRTAPKYNSSVNKNDKTEKSLLFNRGSIVNYDNPLYPEVREFVDGYSYLVNDTLRDNEQGKPTLFEEISDSIIQMNDYNSSLISDKRYTEMDMPSQILTAVNYLFRSEVVNLFFQIELQAWNEIKLELYRICDIDNCSFMKIVTESLQSYMTLNTTANNTNDNLICVLNWLDMIMNDYISMRSDDDLAHGDVQRLSLKCTTEFFNKVFNAIGISYINTDYADKDVNDDKFNINHNIYSIIGVLDSRDIFLRYHDGIVSALEYMIQKHKKYNKIYEDNLDD